MFSILTPGRIFISAFKTTDRSYSLFNLEQGNRIWPLVSSPPQVKLRMPSLRRRNRLNLFFKFTFLRLYTSWSAVGRTNNNVRHILASNKTQRSEWVDNQEASQLRGLPTPDDAGAEWLQLHIFLLFVDSINSAANALWNNMMEPSSRKSHGLPSALFATFRCPTPERPYLATYANNKPTKVNFRRDNSTKIGNFPPLFILLYIVLISLLASSVAAFVLWAPYC